MLQLILNKQYVRADWTYLYRLIHSPGTGTMTFGDLATKPRNGVLPQFSEHWIESD
jgi:hypothetical protein